MRKLTMAELGRLSPGEFLRTEKRPVVVVLDNVRSGLNVGSVFRTSDAFAIEQLYLCGITPKPPHREILKTALGASESVTWKHFPDTTAAVEHLLEAQYAVWPVEQTDASISLNAVEWDQGSRCAFIFGNEVTGISDAVLGMLHNSLEIPQYGTKHSLNIAVSVGIVLWHALYSRLPE